MSYPNSEPLSNSDTTVPQGFNTQSQMGLPEVLQMCCQSRRSGQITFRSGESYGFIFIQHGKVLHAMCGILEGEEAIYTMLTWPGGGFTLNEDILPHKKTIDLTWEQLLFEGARRADEGTTGMKMPGNIPVTTAAPVTNKIQESQPKLTITRPDLPPSTYELVHEFTHAGRHPGNELPLPYPSISNRHCIFITNGPDVVLRDLNSSNGTVVNDAPINEVVLRPGDVIQLGVVMMKFESGVKRPKLQNMTVPLGKKTEPVRTDPNPASVPLGYSVQTSKLPKKISRDPQSSVQVKDDSQYVKGQSAISYQDLAKPPEQKKKMSPILPIIVGVFVLVAAAIVYFYVYKR